MRKIKTLLKKCIRKMFLLGQKVGVDILPRHFYSQIPDLRELKSNNYWQSAMSMWGVEGMHPADQISFLDQELGPSLARHPLPVDVHAKAISDNGEDGGYGEIEADFLYAFICAKRPKKIIQIGCGVSTAIILRAARDIGYTPTIVCVEPYPMDFLSKLQAEGKISLIRERAQLVGIDTLLDLADRDFFFVDSTHTVKVGSEVNRIILEVLPRLSSGVWVHFHDIQFPYDYPRDILTENLFFWSESTLLHAFLTNNVRYKVILSQSFLHYKNPDALKRLFPKYQPAENHNGLRTNKAGHFPSAIYLRVN